MVELIYITRATAKAGGLTHEGSLYGVPAWFDGDDVDSEVTMATPKVPLSKSPYFSSAALHADVYLDGAPLRLCVTADDEAGTAECYATDESGRILHDGENAELVTRLGGVSIVIPSMGFDAWMRRRTERAHAEFMARTAAL